MRRRTTALVVGCLATLAVACGSKADVVGTWTLDRDRSLERARTRLEEARAAAPETARRTFDPLLHALPERWREARGDLRLERDGTARAALTLVGVPPFEGTGRWERRGDRVEVALTSRDPAVREDALRLDLVADGDRLVGTIFGRVEVVLGRP